MLLGSVVGVTLGLHEALTYNRVTSGLIGFTPEYVIPIGTIALAVSLTAAVCLLAAIGPARHVARTNIMAALQVT